MADVAWKRRGKGMERLESNLARVVPDAGPERLAELSKAGMRSYLRYWMESFRLPAWSAERMVNGFAPKAAHHLTDGARRRPAASILALPHMANWDLAGAWVPGARPPFTTVAERLKPETLYDRFVAYRESLGMEVLPHDRRLRLRHARQAAARRRHGLPGRRPRPVLVGRPGRLLRRARPGCPRVPRCSPSRPARPCCRSPSGTTTRR